MARDNAKIVRLKWKRVEDVDSFSLAPAAGTARSASRPFPASFDSECGVCDGVIYTGDMIQMSDGEACHVDCLDED